VPVVIIQRGTQYHKMYMPAIAHIDIETCSPSYSVPVVMVKISVARKPMPVPSVGHHNGRSGYAGKTMDMTIAYLGTAQKFMHMLGIVRIHIITSRLNLLHLIQHCLNKCHFFPK
jgi:hypothetical protein